MSVGHSRIALDLIKYVYFFVKINLNVTRMDSIYDNFIFYINLIYWNIFWCVI